MEIRIHIDCDTIKELEGHLHMLQVQVQDAAKKLKLNPPSDEFDYDAEKELYDDNCYGTHYVTIHNDGETKQAQKHFLNFINSDEHGENPDAEMLWDYCFNKREILKP